MHAITDIIESLLFVADEPLGLDKLKSILETVETKEIRSALETLADRYESRGGGFMLYEVAGGWQLRSRPEFNPWIKRLLQPSPQRLSKPSLETLAIVAYNQPIIRADIEHIRGVDCGGVLRQLMERKLIRVLGRREIPGRPLIYATTRLFLETFGLKDLRDLPSPKEIEEMAAAMEDAGPQGSQEAHHLESMPYSDSLEDLWGPGDASQTRGAGARQNHVDQRVHPWPVRKITGVLHGRGHPSAVHLAAKPAIGSPPPRIRFSVANLTVANSLNGIGCLPNRIF